MMLDLTLALNIRSFFCKNKVFHIHSGIGTMSPPILKLWKLVYSYKPGKLLKTGINTRDRFFESNN